MSMDSSGKIIFAKHSEILQANLKNLAGNLSFLETSIQNMFSVIILVYMNLNIRPSFLNYIFLLKILITSFNCIFENSILKKLNQICRILYRISQLMKICKYYSATLSFIDIETKDGERLPLAVKEMGSCEIYPQTISHNPNGR